MTWKSQNTGEGVHEQAHPHCTKEWACRYRLPALGETIEERYNTEQEVLIHVEILCRSGRGLFFRWRGETETEQASPKGRVRSAHRGVSSTYSSTFQKTLNILCPTSKTNTPTHTYFQMIHEWKISYSMKALQSLWGLKWRNHWDLLGEKFIKADDTRFFSPWPTGETEEGYGREFHGEKWS